MRIVFMGTPDFAVPTLQALLASEHDVTAVITQPDKPKGRGKELQSPPVKLAALKAGIPVFQPAKVRDEEFIKILVDQKPEAIVVVAFGQFLPEVILNLPTYGCINVHASLLPKYRGAAPIQYAVIHGEKKSGVTAMRMDKGMDTGDMLKKVEVDLDEKETGDTLHDKLCVLGGQLMLDVLEELERGTAVRTPQKDEEASYASMLKKEQGHIDFSMPAVQIECLIRGLNSWPSAYTHVNGKTLKLWAADVIDREYDGAFGEIVEISSDRLLVKTGQGTLALTEVQLEGKKRMEVSAFLRGYPLEKGMQLS